MHGTCDRRSVYKYAAGNGKLDVQRPSTGNVTASSFSCVALSDEYLAVGTKDKLIVVATRGKYAGRLVVSDEIPKAAITKMCFSNDGTQLVALVLIDDRESYEEARIYNTNAFRPRSTVDRPNVLLSNDLDITERKWTRDLVHSPSGITFSRKGDMVAICTTHSGGRAVIRILKKEVSTWRLWGIKEVAVHIVDHREWHGLALTGISLYSPLSREVF